MIPFFKFNDKLFFVNCRQRIKVVYLYSKKILTQISLYTVDHS